MRRMTRAFGAALASSALVLGMTPLAFAAPGYEVGAIDWKPCAEAPAVDCGFQPDGEKFQLAVSRRKANDQSRRVGSLVVNASTAAATARGRSTTSTWCRCGCRVMRRRVPRCLRSSWAKSSNSGWLSNYSLILLHTLVGCPRHTIGGSVLSRSAWGSREEIHATDDARPRGRAREFCTGSG